MIKFCSKYVFQYKIEYGIYFLLGIILCGLNTFIPAAMGQFINMFNVETTYSAMLKFIFLLLLLYVGKEIVCYPCFGKNSSIRNPVCTWFRPSRLWSLVITRFTSPFSQALRSLRKSGRSVFNPV